MGRHRPRDLRQWVHCRPEPVTCQIGTSLTPTSFLEDVSTTAGGDGAIVLCLDRMM